MKEHVVQPHLILHACEALLYINYHRHLRRFVKAAHRMQPSHPDSSYSVPETESTYVCGPAKPQTN